MPKNGANAAPLVAPTKKIGVTMPPLPPVSSVIEVARILRRNAPAKTGVVPSCSFRRRRQTDYDHTGVRTETSALFLTQLVQIGIFGLAFTYSSHVIPGLRSLGTALLASAGVASIVVGLAAQNTLGNIVAGVSLLMYRPFRVQDVVQVIAASGLKPVRLKPFAARQNWPACALDQ
jgi:small-conductance mechanosensitive channel